MNIDASRLFEQHENILTDVSNTLIDDALIDTLEIQSISKSQEMDGISESDIENMHHAGPSFQPPTYGKGTSWDHRRPPTKLQALDVMISIFGSISIPFPLYFAIHFPILFKSSFTISITKLFYFQPFYYSAFHDSAFYYSAFYYSALLLFSSITQRHFY